MSHRTRVRHQRPHTVPDQRALLAAATRRTPVCDPRDEELTRTVITSRSDQHPAPRQVASHLTDDRRIAPSFDDIDASDLRLFAMPAGWVPARGADKLDHAAVAAVTAELAASIGRHAAPPVDEHVTHHQVPRGAQLRIVPLADPDESEPFWTADPFTLAVQASVRGIQITAAELQATFVPGILAVVDDAAAELELAIVRLVCAVSDLTVARGRQPMSVTGCCPECGNRFELDKGKIPTHYPTGDPRPCRGVGSDPEGSHR